ncbi:MAG: hypothetical protein ACFB6R_06280 [Alphaproteobacteria bacterium]
MDAVEAIGLDHDKTDWTLPTDAHASDLRPAADPLLRILSTGRVGDIIRQFHHHDGEASRHQRRFKRLGMRVISATIVAVLCGGLFLFIRAIGQGPSSDLLAWAALVVQGAAVAAVAVFTFQLKESTAYEDWMLDRAAAEAERINLFKVICYRPPADLAAIGAIDPAGEGGAQGPSLLALQFEYFRRFQLDVQIRYYIERAQEHRRAAGRYNHMGLILILITGLIALTERLSFSADSLPLSEAAAAALLALAGLTLPVIYQGQDMLKLINGNRRNALRYRVAGQNLISLSHSVEEIRDRIAVHDEGARPVVQGFIDRVHDQIMTEHRQWQFLPKPSSPSDFLEVDT